MKTGNLPGIEGATRPAREHSLSWLTRLFEILSRGETPVDGCCVQHEEPEARRNPEPVRWGNFR